jgi:hypothetical protein
MKRFVRLINHALWITLLTACTNHKTATKEDHLSANIVKGMAATQATEPGRRFKNAVYPADEQLPMKIFTVGNFHEDEVWKTAENEKWIGLFEGQDGFYLAATTIKTERIHDPVVDEDETEKTGWQVSVPNQDSALLLMQAIPIIKERKINAVHLVKNSFDPGDSMQFSYEGSAYQLYATGVKEKNGINPDALAVRQYKLYLTAMVKGKRITQLLVAQPAHQETIIKLLFVGDLDGDTIPDFIIDTSEHYNLQKPTLYLSSPAADDEIVKPVGAHSFVGC